jgi:4-hydroxy-3-methylbut-2-enyl diphosphate reductase
MDILLSQPRGFCAGVTRAIGIVELALERYGAPVYVFHEIVHNQSVVNDLRQRGAVFVNHLHDIPSGGVTIFSAHGVSRAVVNEAKQRHLDAIDATCPLVTKVHHQAQRFARLGYELIMIGHAGHEEVVGTMGSVSAPMALVSDVQDVAHLEFSTTTPLAYVTQTTLSLDDTRDVIAALQRRYPQIVGPAVDDICYATQNRQTAVKSMAAQVDLVLIVGARNSSNSNRLREVAQRDGTPAYLVQDEHEIDPEWLCGVSRVGISSGASTPEVLVQAVIRFLNSQRPGAVVQLPGIEEHVMFRIPSALAPVAA